MTPEKKEWARRLLPIAALVLLAALVLGAIALIPYDLPGTTPPNTYGNLANGGYVAEDGSMLYYVNEKGVLYCMSSPNCYRIDEGADSLCPYGNGIVYRRENGDVIRSDYRGETKETVLTGVEQMALSGNWVFFTRADGQLCKKSLLTGEEAELNLAVRQFLVASNGVLFTDPDGYLKTALTDGTDVAPFLAEPVERFMRYKDYIFYVREGTLCSVVTANAASKQAYFPVDEFNISEDGVLFFTDETGLHSYDLSEQEPTVRDVEIQGSRAARLSVWGEKILYYNEENRLICCQKDGSEWVSLS